MLQALLIFRRELIIGIAQLLKPRRDDSAVRSLPDTRWVLSEHHSHTRIEMPVNMTMENPRTSVISHETEDGTSSAKGYDLRDELEAEKMS